jgi:hypothetical protein
VVKNVGNREVVFEGGNHQYHRGQKYEREGCDAGAPRGFAKGRCKRSFADKG